MLKLPPTPPPRAVALPAGLAPAAAGGAVWLVAPALQGLGGGWGSEFTWGATLLLTGPLLIVPLALAVLRAAPHPPVVKKLLTLAAYLQFPAALLLPPAFALPAGPAAAALTLPWLALCGLLAFAGLALLAARPTLRGDDCAERAPLLFLPIGAAWLFAARAGMRPLEFEPAIVLLTAVHFHFAGFALPLVAAWSARLPGAPRGAGGVGWLVIVSVPLTAAGITTTQLGGPPLAETLAAWSMGIAGLLTAWLQARGAAHSREPAPVRGLWFASSAALGGGMILALLYGSRHLLPVAGLDIPTMQAFHGTANALGFALAGMLAWNVARTPI